MAAGITTSALIVQDDGASRPDLAQREESKYVFSSNDLGNLRSVLRRTCRPIVYADPVSTVYSLYLDDPRLGTCHANLDGVGVRHKTRLRWYDQPTIGSTFFFETKWRRHRAVGKKRVKMSADVVPSDMSFRGLHRSLCESLPLRMQGHLGTDSDAVVLIRYQREHYALEGSTARLTLDYNIRFYPQMGRSRLSLRFPQRMNEVALIECKTNVGDRKALEGALAPLKARPTRFSKYVTACQQLGYAPVI